MSIFKHLWQQYATASSTMLALIGGLFWGINLGREMRLEPRPTAVMIPSSASVATPVLPV
jgi:hypothetical protein